MKAILLSRNAEIFYRMLLGVVFLLSCGDKLLHPEDFAKLIQNYNAIPLFLVNIVALVLPWVELFTGAFLILGIFKQGASFITSLLYATFIILIAQALIRGIDTHCGCFKSTDLESAINARRELILRLIADLISLPMSLVLLFKYKTTEESK